VARPPTALLKATNFAAAKEANTSAMAMDLSRDWLASPSSATEPRCSPHSSRVKTMHSTDTAMVGHRREGLPFQLKRVYEKRV
jgi:hypothetical protein